MPNDWLAIEDLRKAKDAPPATADLRKAYGCEVKSEGEDGDRRLAFTISTESVDRYGDKVFANGWKLDAYRKNPVVLWAHDYGTPPIAKAVQLSIDGTALKAIAQFATKEEYPFADTIYQLFKGGFLSATSVGFRAHKWNYVDDPGRKYGIDFLEQELLEFSAVPVPANPEALIEAKKKGIEVGPLADWARGIVKGLGLALVGETELQKLQSDAEAKHRAARAEKRAAEIARLKSQT